MKTLSVSAFDIGRRFLATKTLAMGFTKEVVRVGNGSKPRVGQIVTVHCTGYGKNRDLNVKFWSTKDPGQQVCRVRSRSLLLNRDL